MSPASPASPPPTRAFALPPKAVSPVEDSLCHRSPHLRHSQELHCAQPDLCVKDSARPLVGWAGFDSFHPVRHAHLTERQKKPLPSRKLDSGMNLFAPEGVPRRSVELLASSAEEQPESTEAQQSH